MSSTYVSLTIPYRQQYSHTRGARKFIIFARQKNLFSNSSKSAVDWSDHVRFPVTLYLNRDVKVSRLGLHRTARILLKRDESFLRLALRRIEFGDCLIRDEKFFRLALRKFPNFRIFETV